MRFSFARLCSAALLLALAGCGGPEQNGLRAAQLAQSQAIMQEPAGDYYVGRRYYNANYKFWGYVRKPRQTWREAKLVMLNEKQKLAPDREQNQFGVDNNFEYHLKGYFTGETVYEPASNRFYPEFMLQSWEIVNKTPTSIFPPNSGAYEATTTSIYQPN